MLTKRSAIALVKKFTNEVRASGVDLKKVILFGSYAKNTRTEYSDIDVAMVSDEFIGFRFKDLDAFVKIKIKKEYVDIEPHTFSTSYFEKGDAFIDEIKNTGIVID